MFTNAPAGLKFYSDPGIPKTYRYTKLNVWEPRMGIAWDPDGKGRQSIRVGGAIVHEVLQLYGPATGIPYSASITLTAPAGGFTNPWVGYPGGNPYPLPSPPPKNVSFPAFAASGGDLQHPIPTSTAQWNVSYQRELPGNWLATITYLGNKTSHLWLGLSINPAVYIPGNCVAGQYGLTAPGPCSTTGNTNYRRVLYLENPTQGQYYAGVGETDMGANANYNAALFSIQHRFADNFTLLANYAWSHCLDDGDNLGPASNLAYQNPYNRNAEYGNCGFDHRHVANASLVAVSPIRGRWMRRAMGGWQIAPLISMRTGEALNVTTGIDNSLTGQGTDRPNIILPDPYATPKTISLWLNPAAFSRNPVGTVGNLGRNVVYGPGFFEFDASLSRTFAIRERIRLDARFEAFNLINHPNFSDPATTLNSSNFGKILSAADPRILQFAVKVHF